MNTIAPRVAPGPLSRRAKCDVATLIIAGVASSAFFLLPLWPSVFRATPVPTSDARRLAAIRPAIDSPPSIAALVATMTAQPSVSISPRRAAIRSVRAPRPADVVQARADTIKPSSRLARFLLGDGSERVQPFPLADRRAER